MKELYKSAPLKLSDQAGFIENTLPGSIQVLRAGKYYHQGREIFITEQSLSEMVSNFKNNVRGIDLMLDFGHDTEGEAAAWFEDIYLSEDGNELWARVIWTESGKDAVLSKKYRYISADFDFNYTDNENLTEHGPTLFGAGLTNRPVVKRMEPVIQLAEKVTYNEENKMDLEKKIDELVTMMKAVVSKMEFEEPKKEEPKEEMGEEKKMEEAEEDKKEEMKEEKMSEEAKDEEKREVLSETAKLIEENRILKKENEFNKLFSEGKVVEAQRSAFMEGDMVAFSEASARIHTENVGTSKEGDKVVDAEEQVIKLAEKIVNEDNVSFAEATTRVLKGNPSLAEKYRNKFEK